MKIVKLVVLCTTVGLCSTAFAYTGHAQCGDTGTGVYVGGQLGYGSADYGSGIKNAFNVYSVHSNDEDDLAGRFYIGYQLTKIFGIETGYTIFSDNTYKGQSANGLTTSKSRLETQSIDLLAAVGTPLTYEGFGATLKGGAAYVMSDYSHSGNGSDAGFRPADSSNERFAPAVGASVFYKLPYNTAVDISYLHIFSPANVAAPEADLVTLGLSYRFV